MPFRPLTTEEQEKWNREIQLQWNDHPTSLSLLQRADHGDRRDGT